MDNVNKTTLDLVEITKSCRVIKINGEGNVKRRLYDMGITPGAVIYVKKYAPMKDPIEVTIRGYELTLRKSEAMNIVVEVVK